MSQFYKTLLIFGILIKLLLQISCLNCKTNSVINKPQLDVDGHAHNETEVIKRSTKLNLCENLNDEIKLESNSNISIHDGCKFNGTLLNGANLIHISNAGTDDQEMDETNKLLYESNEPLPPEEYVFKNGKRTPVSQEFAEMQNYLFEEKRTPFFRGYVEDDNEELSLVKPVNEDLVTWVNEKYVHSYESRTNMDGAKICKST